MLIPEPFRRASGSLIASNFSFDGAVAIESPVEIGGGCAFFETNAIGYLSCIRPGARALNASIGRYVSTAENVVIGPQQHPLDRISTHVFTYHSNVKTLESLKAYQEIADPEQRIPCALTPRTTIGNDVWIGRNAIVMPGLTIGHGAAIGAGAVVTKDVAPYTIVAGVPAKPIRKRFNDALIEDLLASSWWDYDIAPLKGLFSYTDIPGFLGLLAQGIKEGRLQKLQPQKYVFSIRENTCQMDEA